MKKRLLTFVLMLAMALSLCACGKGAGDYSELEKLIDKGQYDAAITLIENMKDVAGKEPVSKAEIDEKFQAVLDKIVGEYTPIPNNIDLDYEKVVINADSTISLDGNTYAFELKQNDDGDYYINYETKKDDGSTTYKSLWFNIYDNGYITAAGYQKLGDTVSAQASELLNEHVGTYKRMDDYTEDVTYVIKSDFTIEKDGVSYPLVPSYSDWDGGSITLYAMGMSDYGNQSLSFDKRDSGLKTLFWNYGNVDQIEYVDITAANLNDYFEWGDWQVDYKNYNAFNELTSVSFAKYYELKDEYVSRYEPSFSSIAFEYSYNYRSDVEKVITWNSNDDSVSITTAETQYTSTGTNTSTTSYMNSRGSYDDEGRYTVEGYYFYGMSEYMNLEDENLQEENGIYTLKRGYGYDYDNEFVIDRSATTIALIKP